MANNVTLELALLSDNTQSIITHYHSPVEEEKEAGLLRVVICQL